MREIVARGESLPEAYHNALWWMYKAGEIVDCPAYNKEAGLTMMIERPLTEPRRSKLFPGGPYDLERYRQEMLDGILDFEIEQGNWRYTYHDRITCLRYTEWDSNGDIVLHHVDQTKFVVDDLRKDPFSRRAIINVRSPYDIGSDDPACLQSIQFFIRHNRLDCSVLFRSNDLFEALYMNAFALILLQQKIASELGIEVGTYKHMANSAHVYEKDFDKLEGAFKRIDSAPLEDLTFFYATDWAEQMEKEKPNIEALISSLKGQE